MKIETKFDIGQKVWFTDEFIHLIHKGTIESILISDAKYNLYTISIDKFIWHSVYENFIFTTKSEAEQAVKRLEGKDE